jgi:murein L,D-transpeptidase YcbB/YkuD
MPAPADPFRTQLEAPAAPAFVGTTAADHAVWAQTRKFYALRGQKPVWVVDQKLQPQVKVLAALLSAAADEGLNPANYDARGLLDEARRLGAGHNASADADFELHASFLLLHYASDVAQGRTAAAQVDPSWSDAVARVDVPALVNSTLSSGRLTELVQQLEPPHRQYADLKKMLQRYRQLAAGQALRPVPLDIIGSRDASAPAWRILRDDLSILGKLDSTSGEEGEPAVADSAAAEPASAGSAGKSHGDLAPAIQRFQARRGLDPTGVLDRATIDTVNVPLSARVRQLELNLERWRWLPGNFGSPYVLVNVPAFSLQVRDADSIALKMRAIVGKVTDRTPIFSAAMNEVVFSPYWKIPRSIERKEMLPIIQRDRGFFRKKNIEVVRVIEQKATVVDPSSVNWSDEQSLTDVRLRQKPGENNALGLVKFLFPNRYNVYLHDTPSDRQFDQLNRDLSHGCVRVDHPDELAAYLLRDFPDWGAANIDAAMHAGVERHVYLKRPVPVHIVYLTAWVDERGVLHFFDDVYGYDRKQAALADAGTPGR